MNCLVSVIIPAYNCEKYIERCLQSIVNQTYSNIEIIIVNDGSTDSTEKKIFTFLGNDSRIKYFFQENQGAAVARNVGVSIATGKYLLFVDSDDYADTRLIEKSIIYAEKEKLDVVCFAHNKVTNCEIIEYGFGWDCQSVYGSEFVLCKIMSHEVRGYIGDKLFLLEKWKELELRFEPNMYCEDWFPITKYFSGSERVGFINEPLYNYVQHEFSSIHTHGVKVIKDYNYAVDCILKLCVAKRLDNEYILLFKSLSLLSILHELYYVSQEMGVSLYKLARSEGLPSFCIKYSEIFISKKITWSMKIRIVLWKLHMYVAIKNLSIEMNKTQGGGDSVEDKNEHVW